MPHLYEQMADLNEEVVLKTIAERVKNEGGSLGVVEELRGGMEILGQRFADGEYSLAELMMGAEIFRECLDMVEPSLEKDSVSTRGRIVIGTVKGDVHDLGKNIVAAMLKGAGFEVHDIGVDKPPERFVEKIREVDADIVGLSCLLTSTLDSMRKTVSMIRESGVDIKIMIGGGVFSRGIESTVTRVDGADGFGKDAVEAVNMAKEWVTTTL